MIRDFFVSFDELVAMIRSCNPHFLSLAATDDTICSWKHIKNEGRTNLKWKKTINTLYCKLRFITQYLYKKKQTYAIFFYLYKIEFYKEFQ